MNPSKYAWRVVVSMRISKDSSRFFTVEAVALQNLPQTLRGRERSKRGYATPLLFIMRKPWHRAESLADKAMPVVARCCCSRRPSPQA
jgi:hypothetical protein